MKKAIIVGAGIGGLATAVRLAQKGYSVEVFENNFYPGGKLTVFENNGFRFDAGPSLFTMPDWVDELFQLCNKNPKDYFNYQRLDPVCNYFFSDGKFLQAYAEPENFAKEAEKVLGIKAELIIKYLKKSDFIYKQTSFLFLKKSLHRVKTYLSWKVAWSFLQLPFMSVSETLHKSNIRAMQGNKNMAQFFDRFATYNGSNPYQAPGILAIIPHLEFNIGAFFPKGGMHAITQSVYELAKELGVEFHFGSPVEEILVENSKVIGVKSKGFTHLSEVVVSNMDVFFTYRKLMPHQKAPEKTLAQERSSSALIFYWGIKKEFPNMDVHNIFFAENYEREFKNLFENKTFSEDLTVYVHVSSKVEKTDAPDGCENWFVMVNAPANIGQDWEQLKKEARKNILSRLSSVLMEDIESLIISEDVLEPITIEQKTQSYQGSLYGTASNNQMAAFFRHPNFSNKIENLYFVGGSVHPGGGIPLALSSAKIVADLIKG